jgi:hypothetical protein
MELSKHIRISDILGIIVEKLTFCARRSLLPIEYLRLVCGKEM